MKVFLDTNVLLDWLLDRKNTFADEATMIIEAAEKGVIEAFISAGSMYTIAYILEKAGRKGSELRDNIGYVLATFKIIPTNNIPFQKACLRNMKDLEDAFQYEIALSIKPDYFVTGNLKDFASQNTTLLPVISPLKMLAIIQANPR